MSWENRLNYEGNKEKLQKIARDKYQRLSEEEKKIKKRTRKNQVPEYIWRTTRKNNRRNISEEDKQKMKEGMRKQKEPIQQYVKKNQRK